MKFKNLVFMLFFLPFCIQAPYDELSDNSVALSARLVALYDRPFHGRSLFNWLDDSRSILYGLPSDDIQRGLAYLGLSEDEISIVISNRYGNSTNVNFSSDPESSIHMQQIFSWLDSSNSILYGLTPDQLRIRLEFFELSLSDIDFILSTRYGVSTNDHEPDGNAV